MLTPPPLPARLSQPGTVAIAGSLVWAVAALVLLVAALLGWHPLDIWFTTCLAGVGVGALGYGIFTWQRAAARRGSRTAQEGLD